MQMKSIVALGLNGLLGSACFGQWSSDSAVNTLVSGAQTNCVVTHSATSTTGATWVAWYDAASGYDVRVQQLTAAGVPVFAEPILAIEQSVSYVQDLDLACDSAGRAAVTFSDGTRTAVALIDTDGQMLYQHSFNGGGAFTANAQVCGTSDGLIMAGWGEDNNSQFQLIRSDGTFVWDQTVVVAGSGTLTVSDIQPALSGGVVASFVTYATFSGPKRLLATAIAADGSFPWGAAPGDVFTSGSLQYGNYPEFIADGVGGGVFTWYSTSPLMARAQWVAPNGQMLLGTNGMAMTSETTHVHVSPHACLSPSGDEATVFWVRQTGGQSQAGLQANRINNEGDLLWGATGVQLQPLDSTYSILDLSAQQLGDLAIATWQRARVTGSSTIRAISTDADGNVGWSGQLVELGTPLRDRSDLTTSVHDEQLVAAWSDERNGSTKNIMAQNLNADGTLGETSSCAADFNGDGQVDGADLTLLLGAWGTANQTFDIDGNGTVDGGDLVIILGTWGDC